MDTPLWIDRYQPTIDELPQTEVREYLRKVPDGPVNLLLVGPAGSGKTAAVHALAAELHADPEHDLEVINVADFFGMTKSELVEDPRVSGFLDTDRRRDSKAAIVNHVLTELASHPPVSGTFKTILLDNAEAIREDFQQALRRVMERHYGATQFVLTTRRRGAILDPIVSRCAQVPVRAPTSAEITDVLAAILEAEEIPADPEGLAYLAEYADGDLRQAITAAQTTAVEAGEVTMESAYAALEGVGYAGDVEAMLAAAEEGSFGDARGMLDDLLIDEGFDGEEVLTEILSVARSRYDTADLAAITRLAGEIDVDLSTGSRDRVHLAHFLSQLPRTVD